MHGCTYTWIIIKKKQCKPGLFKNPIKKSHSKKQFNLYKIKKKPQMNYTFFSKN